MKIKIIIIIEMVRNYPLVKIFKSMGLVTLVFVSFKGFTLFMLNYLDLAVLSPVITGISVFLLYLLKTFLLEPKQDVKDINLKKLLIKSLIASIVVIIIASVLTYIRLNIREIYDFIIIFYYAFISFDCLDRVSDSFIVSNKLCTKTKVDVKGISYSMNKPTDSSPIKNEEVAVKGEKMSSTGNKSSTNESLLKQDIIDIKRKDLYAINKQITSFISKLENMKKEYDVDPSIEKSTNRVGVTAPEDSKVSDEKLEHLKKVVEIVDEAYGRQSELFHNIVEKDYIKKELVEPLKEHEKLVSKYENM